MNGPFPPSARLSRGAFLAGAASASALAFAGRPASAANQAAPMTPQAALERLRDGHAAFLAGAVQTRPQSAAQREALAAGQHPFAAILACADSRTGPEIVFHQALGDLFVVRVAGNVAGTMELGSLEYAAAELAVPLIVVLGHSRCGAVKAAVDVAKNGTALPGHIADLAAAIVPAAQATRDQSGDWVDNATRENVRRSVGVLKESRVLSPLVDAGRLQIVGAVYALETGAVSYLD